MADQSVILGIESSCDDTAAAVVCGTRLLSSVVSSQAEHAPFGGVVPEIASRAHQRHIVPVVVKALAHAGIDKRELDAVAVTAGPGLAGSLMVGVSFAKALAYGMSIPLVAVNHLEGHVYSIFLAARQPPFPFLSLVVSGGHTQIALIEAGLRHEKLGSTRDDAAGEAFDKVAQLLGLGYPGGPAIDRRAKEGDPVFQAFPRTDLGSFDYSFSGIKTAVLYYLNRFDDVGRADLLTVHRADLCASFQEAVVDMLVAPLERAIEATGVRHIAISGGVSANTRLRHAAQSLADRKGCKLYIPPLHLCTDNAAMIAITGLFRLKANLTSPLTVSAEPDLSMSTGP